MPARRVPNSDSERTKALNACFKKYNGTDAADRLFSAAQFTALGTLRGTWNSISLNLGGLLSTQTSATAIATPDATTLRRVASHFIQVFNLAVERGTFPRQSRAFYHLDTNSNKVPGLRATATLLLWAKRLVDGEAARIVAGGEPMSMPPVTEVSDALTSFSTADNIQSTAKDAYDLGEEAIADQRPAADVMIRDLWDTIEFNLRTNPPPSLRRKAREWGIKYVGNDPVPIAP